VKYLPAIAVFLLMLSTGMSLDRREFIANGRRITHAMAHFQNAQRALPSICSVCVRSASGDGAIREMDALLAPATNLTQTLHLQLPKTLDL
jgi:hypothetical protein